MSRKDQSNKKKLSPLTNHKNTKNGIIKGGFDRISLFQQAEQGFDKLFIYNRHQSESFQCHNTMKNGSISKQLATQEQLFANENKNKVQEFDEKENTIYRNHDSKQSFNHENNLSGDSLLSISSLGSSNNHDVTPTDESHTKKLKKKKKKVRRL